MKVLVLGGTDLTAKVLEAMLAARIDVVGGVYLTSKVNISYQPAGVRNLRYATLSSIYGAAGIAALEFVDNAGISKFAQKIGADFCIVAGWYHMVPKSLRAMFARGCVGLHASLLPKLRGGAPLNWAILSDASETGVSMFALEDGVDDGPIYGQVAFEISPRSTITELVERSIAASVRLVQDCLPKIAEGTLKPRAQTGTPSYCLQRRPEDSLIDWRQPATALDRLVRASTHPYAGAYTHWNGETLRIWRTALPEVPEILGAPGQIVRLPHSDAIYAVTGHGVLEIIDATNESNEDCAAKLAVASNQRFETK